MAKKRVFISFDFDNDRHLKASFIGQAKLPDSPFSLVDYSLQESHPEKTWLSKAQSAISKCDVFIVLLGNKTHKAPGVKKEVGIAKGLRKKRFQLRTKGTNPTPVLGAGDVFAWKWKNIRAQLY